MSAPHQCFQRPALQQITRVLGVDRNYGKNVEIAFDEDDAMVVDVTLTPEAVMPSFTLGGWQLVPC